MKLSLIITVITLIISTALIYFLSLQNKIAGSGDKSKSYFAFNWKSVSYSRDIMQYWKNDSKRTKAIKNIVYLDYAFMIIYSSYFCFMLFQQHAHQSRTWLKHWLIAGLFGIILCLLTDAIQDYKIYRYIVSNDIVNEMRGYTYFKWSCFLFGIIPLIISVLMSD